MNCNCGNGFPEPPACRWQTVGLLSLYNWASQSLRLTLLLCFCLCPIASVSLENPDQDSILPQSKTKSIWVSKFQGQLQQTQMPSLSGFGQTRGAGFHVWVDAGQGRGQRMRGECVESSGAVRRHVEVWGVWRVQEESEDTCGAHVQTSLLFWQDHSTSNSIRYRGFTGHITVVTFLGTG